jgi:ACS family sodium-dependent inorganic phosphate cotransporter
MAIAAEIDFDDAASGEPSKPQPRACLKRRHAIALVSHLGLFVVYTLRVILSVAIVPMQKQYHWTDKEKGIILSSFFGGYLLLQLAGGYLAVRYGPKLVFGLGVLIPSILTAVTPPIAWSIPMLIVLRVLTGLGESVTYPALHSLLGSWSPKSGELQLLPAVAYDAVLLCTNITGSSY